MQNEPNDVQPNESETNSSMRRVTVTLHGTLVRSAFRSFEIEVSNDTDLTTIAAETLNELADFEQIPWDYGDCSYLDLQDFSIDEDVANKSDDRTAN